MIGVRPWSTGGCGVAEFASDDRLEDAIDPFGHFGRVDQLPRSRNGVRGWCARCASEATISILKLYHATSVNG